MDSLLFEELCAERDLKRRGCLRRTCSKHINKGESNPIFAKYHRIVAQGDSFYN